MPRKLDVKLFTISNAEEDESSSLFVLNRSNPRGNINVVVRDSSGRSAGIQIPITWVPVDLSNFARKEDILNTPDFRRLVSRQVVQIVEPKSALNVFNSADAKAELNRINNVLEEDNDLAYAPEAKSDAFENNDGVNPFMLNASKRTDIEALLTELNSKFDTFTAEDVEYLKAHSTSEEVRKWCDEALALFD